MICIKFWGFRKDKKLHIFVLFNFKACFRIGVGWAEQIFVYWRTLMIGAFSTLSGFKMGYKNALGRGF